MLDKPVCIYDILCKGVMRACFSLARSFPVFEDTRSMSSGGMNI